MGVNHFNPWQKWMVILGRQTMNFLCNLWQKFIVKGGLTRFTICDICRQNISQPKICVNLCNSWQNFIIRRGRKTMSSKFFNILFHKNVFLLYSNLYK